ncbi:MAG: alkaline phosphatase family protein [Candidatus Acidoferrales bacterium]|nr:alkaline phosphatase family protein [Candidatus Acidoferrales bacterium]
MIGKNLRCTAALLLAANLVLVTPGVTFADHGKQTTGNDKGGVTTTTPIKHVVVIFQENRSFDHYFGTYPDAENPKGEVAFHAKENTPTVNGLTQGLIDQNNSHDATKTIYKPFRFDPSQNYTCDQNHDYTPEQQAFDSGLLDRFPEFTATPCSSTTYPDVSALGAGVVMGYYDGNTVTGLWNYAQHFSLNDNFFGTNFGPSTPGVLNVISGMTGNADPATEINTGSDVVNNSVLNDPDPFYDDCSGSEQVGMSSSNKNIGDLLNAKGITWGWFQGGFTPSSIVNGKAVCATTTNRLDGTPETAYSPHHNGFQYYASTSNPHHVAPAGLSEIGHNGPANHLYDLSFFQQAALAGDLPSVSYLKANRAQDGHPGNSSPLDEQQFVVGILNFLQTLPEWQDTAVIITWDDSDGWYDHVAGPIVNQSASAPDAATGPGMCGTGINSLAGLQSRCGYGPRIPVLVISPFARKNFVDHTLTDFSSVVRFIEDNWGLPRIANGSFDVIAGSVQNMFDFDNKRDDTVFLDPVTGQVVAIGVQH